MKEESEGEISHDNIPVEGFTLTELKPKVREYIKQHMKLYAFVLKEQNSVFKSVDEAEFFIYEQFGLLVNDYLQKI